MTQLFDTATYDHDQPGRHLRSIPAVDGRESSTRTTQWQLDEQTIAAGRRGIELAREALRASSASASTSAGKRPKRRAA
jgi:hypothetical protein